MKTPPPEFIPKEELVSLLAPSLGREKSNEVVTTAIEVLELLPDALTSAQAYEVLDALGRGTGLIGIAARLARLRARFETSDAPPEFDDETTDVEITAPASSRAPARTARPRQAPTTRPASSPAPLQRHDLVMLLTPTLGEEKAGSLVREAAIALGYTSPTLSLMQACGILERLSETGGIVGTTATFAKARLLLRAPGSRK